MLADLLHNNRLWSESRRREDPDYSNVITGLDPGEVFVHRNVANLVHRGDLNLLSVLEFAVDVLGVQHIIVCGHRGCGGVRAAMEPHRHGVMDHWLQPIRDLADEAGDALRDHPTTEARNDHLCELSIRAQVNNLARTPIMRAAWGRGAQVRLHGWIYGLTNGLLHDLQCDVEPGGTTSSAAG